MPEAKIDKISRTVRDSKRDSNSNMHNSIPCKYLKQAEGYYILV